MLGKIIGNCPNEFKCENCKKTFHRITTKEQDIQKSKKFWGDIPEDEQITICHDCYQKFMESISICHGH